MNAQIHFAVTDASVVGEVRRTAAAQAKLLGFQETQIGEISIVASELASNLAKYAEQGEIFLMSYPEASRLDLISLDSGPGMANVSLCMTDGYSTSQTPGGGLGALSRLTQSFDIFSRIGSGTIISCIFVKQGVPYEKKSGAFLNLPYPGETVSGDSVAYFEGIDGSLAVVADGLGHGPDAHAASQLAIDVAARNRDLPPKEILEKIHRALERTRGAAVAVAGIDHQKEVVHYAAVGNISAQIVGDTRTHALVSKDGIVGQNVRRVESIAYPWSRESLLIMFSDGLNSRTRIDSDAYPGLRVRSPEIIMSSLMRDFRRGRDDACVLVCRAPGPRPSGDL